MKFPIKFFIAASLIVLVQSCDRGYETMNKNPNAYNEPVIENMFSYSVIRTVFAAEADRHWASTKYCATMMQYFAVLDLNWAGDKYLYLPNYSGGMFDAYYTYPIKQITQMVSLLQGRPECVNELAMVRILKVLAYHRLTDIYGDIPYSQAGQAYLEGLYQPPYDKQEDIYADMLHELEDAASLLQNQSGQLSFGAADYLYAGDVASWKRFAYSLMLRLGMRLTKVDPAMAETYVKKALEAGVITDVTQTAKLDHTAGTDVNYNGDSNWFHTEDFPVSGKGNGTRKMSKTFIGYLKETADPRLSFYATLWQGNADATQLEQYSKPELQQGLPNGYDNTSIKEVYPSWNDDMMATFSEINLNTIGSLSAPNIIMSCAEVEFLQAEAALRGWTTDSPKEHYDKAIRAAMAVTSFFPGGFVIDEEQVNAFLQKNPYQGGAFEQQMEQIHQQFWVAIFMDNFESFANWRRTGYPKLVPTKYPTNVTGGAIPRRLRYPESEASLNQENYLKAVGDQGPDLFTTRIWWDKE